MALDLFKLHGLDIKTVPMDATGMDLDQLRDILKEQHPALIYTIPNFHNPTGTTTVQAHRERLLWICEQHGIALVEDGFEEEMKYFDKNECRRLFKRWTPASIPGSFNGRFLSADIFSGSASGVSLYRRMKFSQGFVSGG